MLHERQPLWEKATKCSSERFGHEHQGKQTRNFDSFQDTLHKWFYTPLVFFLRLSAVSLAVQQTTACPKLLSAQGRGRYFIRLMLSRRTLGNVVSHLLHTSSIMEVSEIIAHFTFTGHFHKEIIDLIHLNNLLICSGTVLTFLYWGMRNL